MNDKWAPRCFYPISLLTSRRCPFMLAGLASCVGAQADNLSNSPPLPFSAVAISASHLIVPSIFACFFVKVLEEITLSGNKTVYLGRGRRRGPETAGCLLVAPSVGCTRHHTSLQQHLRWPPFLSPESSTPRNLAFWRGLFSSWLNIKDLKAIYRQCGFATNLGQDAALFPQFTA